MIPKLVRDKIPAQIRARGAVPVVRRLDPKDTSTVLAFLLSKLHEAVEEYGDKHNPEELVDVIEVVFDLFACHGWSEHQFLEAFHAKRSTSGGFFDLVVLEGVVEPTRASSQEKGTDDLQLPPR